MANAETPKVGIRTMVHRMRAKPEEETPIELSMDLAREMGPIFQLPNPGHRLLVVSSFPLVDELCDEQRFDKSLGMGLQERRATVGDGLFTAYTSEPNWRKAHNILLPAFSRQAIKAYMPEMLDLADQLMLKWERLNPDDEIDVPSDMTRLTMDTIGLCGFGYRFNSFYRTDQHPFVVAMVDSLSKATEKMAGGDHPLANTVIDSLTRWLRPSSVEVAVGGEIKDPELAHNRDVMYATVDELIHAREAEGAEAIAAHHDLLSYMLTGADKQSGERLDDTTIRYELLTFLVAGHETTSGLLSFALYFLLKHPEVAQRAYDEVDRVLGSDLGVSPTYEQVHALTYVQQILKECLRLWPTAPAFTRHSYQETTLGGRYAIAPDDLIMILTPMLHRDPSVWGKDAEEFNPDHFSPEAEQTRPANAYKPFGSGQRACIGREFALQEATLVLGMLLQRFEFIDSDKYELELKQTLTIKPNNFKITIRPRTQRLTQPVTTGTVTAAMAPAETEQTLAAVAAEVPEAGTAEAHNTPLLVLFGSNLGTCEDLAHQIATGGTAQGYAPTVAPLDDYTGKLPTRGAVVIVTSSYNGTPPDNAAKFCAWLRGESLSRDALAGVRYTVFGCGNHEWTATYQAIPHLIDSKLEEHGARRIYAHGEADAAADFDDAFRGWYGSLWQALGNALSLAPAAKAATTKAPAAPGTLYTVERVSAPVAPLIAAYGVRPLTIQANRELQRGDGASPPDRSTRHIEVVLPEGMSYQTGDHLGVLPRNGTATLLQRVLNRFHLAGDAYVRISRNSTSSATSAPALPLDQPLPVIDVLSHYVELQEVASRAQIAVLAQYIEAPEERQQLLALADDARYASEVLAKRLTVLDLLELFPSCALPFNVYLEMLHPLRVRYYSI
ncbi:MAG TPA: cytochrome P450 [Ktedonobacterales bacterium]